MDAWKTWTAEEKPDLNRAVARLNGYDLEGAGEILVCAASDFENFMAPRPVLNEQALQELTEVTRVNSYNPWLLLAWIVTGQTAGGTQIASPSNRPSREEALWLYTLGSVWFSGEEDVKGRIAPDQYADFAILSADYLSVPEEQIGTIESVLTVTGGDVV